MHDGCSGSLGGRPWTRSILEKRCRLVGPSKTSAIDKVVGSSQGQHWNLINLGRLKRGPLCGPTDCRIESEEDLGGIGNSSGTVPGRLSSLGGGGCGSCTDPYLRLRVRCRQHVRAKRPVSAEGFHALRLVGEARSFVLVSILEAWTWKFLDPVIWPDLALVPTW